MSAVNKEVIAPITAAATSPAFNTNGVFTVMADTLGDDESVTLEQSRDGTNWQEIKLNGVVQIIDSSHNQITISGPGLFRVVKSVTVAAVGVTIWRADK